MTESNLGRLVISPSIYISTIYASASVIVMAGSVTHVSLLNLQFSVFIAPLHQSFETAAKGSRLPSCFLIITIFINSMEPLLIFIFAIVGPMS